MEREKIKRDQAVRRLGGAITYKPGLAWKNRRVRRDRKRGILKKRAKSLGICQSQLKVWSCLRDVETGRGGVLRKGGRSVKTVR